MSNCCGCNLLHGILSHVKEEEVVVVSPKPPSRPKPAVPDYIKNSGATVVDKTCENISESGDYVRKIYYMNVWDRKGTLNLIFSPYVIPDNIIIKLDNIKIFESGMFGGDKIITRPTYVKADKVNYEFRSGKFTYDGDKSATEQYVLMNIDIAERDNYITIEVIPNENKNTVWDIITTCPPRI